MSILAAIGTAVAAFLALVGLLHGLVENKRHHVRETETFYLKLYWEMLKELPDWVVMNQDPPSNLAGEKRTKVDELAHLYLRLSQDEFSKRKRGLVSDTTYREWAKGFHTQLQRSPMSDQWNRICDGDLKQGNEANFKYVRNFSERNVAAYGLYDPCKMWWIRRWWRGLTPGANIFWRRRINPVA